MWQHRRLASAKARTPSAASEFGSPGPLHTHAHTCSCSHAAGSFLLPFGVDAALLCLLPSPLVCCFLLLLCVLFAWVCPALLSFFLSSHGVFFALFLLALPLHACCAPEESCTYRCNLFGKVFLHPVLFFLASFLWFYVCDLKALSWACTVSVIFWTFIWRGVGPPSLFLLVFSSCRLFLEGFNSGPLGS